MNVTFRLQSIRKFIFRYLYSFLQNKLLLLKDFLSFVFDIMCKRPLQYPFS